MATNFGPGFWPADGLTSARLLALGASLEHLAQTSANKDVQVLAETLDEVNGKILENGTKVPLDVKAGDKILFGKYSGSEVTLDNEEYLILREEDVLCILE